jgi:hypothetical protein
MIFNRVKQEHAWCMTNSKEFSKKKHTNFVVFGVFGIWDPTGCDLGLVGKVSH